MKRILTTLFAFALMILFMQSNANAQLTGTKTIPGDYATLLAAITDLNTNGVGGGGVIFNIAPGYTETIPSGGYAINVLSNPPGPGNPVTIQRNGAGTNPLFSSSAGGSGTIAGTGLGTNGDAFLKLVGTDNVTITNIDFTENYTGGTTSLNMEYMILLVRGSSTNGCKNITITGCTFQQQKSDIYSNCIASINRDAAGTITNPTTTDGRHENVSVQGCTMNNSYNGMYFQGYSAPSPYDLFDHFYNIGNVTGNTLTNIGSAGVTNTNIVYGVFAQYLDSISVNNNTIRVNNGSNSVTMYGILLSTGINSSANVIGNTISDTSGATTLQMTAIGNAMGGTGVDNIVNIQNNTIINCVYTAPTSGNSYLIYLSANPFTLNVTGNVIRNLSHGNGSSTATGSVYGVYCLSSNSTSGATYNVANNSVDNFTRSQSAPGSGNMVGLYFTSAAFNTEMNNNTVDSLFNTSTTGLTAGMYYGFSVAAGMVSVHDNTVTNIFKDGNGTTGAMYGIYQSSSTGNSKNYNNTVNNIRNSGTTATTYGYYNFGSTATGTEEVYNNIYRDIYSKSGGVCIGINAATGLSTSNLQKNIYGNDVFNIANDSIGQTGGIRVDYVTYGDVYGNRMYNISNNQNTASLPATYGMLLGATIIGANYNVYNNMISEIDAPNSNSSLGVLGLWVNGGDTANISYNTIYMDSSATGVNTGNYALYLAGTTDATMKNNIIINKFVPAGTGANIAIFKATGVIYNTASNNNNVYVPAGASNFFYYDGAATYGTFAAYKSAVSPGESNTFTENSPFVNVSTHPYNLDMSTTIATLCEGGAMPIAGITTDIHGNTRNAVTPDVGADEFNGIGPVTVAPTLVAPANGATLVALNPLMDWNSVSSANAYRIMISDDSTFTTTVLDTNVSGTEIQLANNFLSVNTQYFWRVAGRNEAGDGPFSGTWSFTTGVTNIEPTSLPIVYELYRNYPNPFNPTTKIKFDIPENSFVSLKIYDITGREVANLVSQEMAPGRYEKDWNASAYSSGIYFYRITAGSFVKTYKMILSK